MNTEQRIDKIENKVDNIIEENTKAFNKLSETLDSVVFAMQTLTNNVIENQRLTMQLALNVDKLEHRIDKIDKLKID